MNIYIQEDLKEKLKKEPTMSGLVNRLLRDHYSLQTPRTKDPNKISSPIDPQLQSEVDGMIAGGLCRIHGIPLTAEGKCLQKGCKYS